MTDMSEIFGNKPSDEDLRIELINALEEISFTPGELLKWMSCRGDYRDISASIRGIQRMMSGETRVSGPMMVLVNMLVRQHRRLKARHPNLAWSINEHGTYSAQVDGWHVYIAPQPKRRWLLSCSSGPSRQDYSPPFGRWLETLEEAQNKALVFVEEGMADMAEIERGQWA